MWPYASYEVRQRTRAKVLEAGFWPPKGGDSVRSGEISLLNPASFSPLQ
jgi:hypothetical protein